MNDLFGGDDRYADLLARLEALESIVYQTPKAKRSKADEPLNEAWQLWNRHRNGKGWTAKARELSMKKLRELAGSDGALAMQIVCQSIERGWTGLFPITGKDGRSAGSTATHSPAKYKTPAEALAKTETEDENRRAYKANLRRLGIRED